MKKYNCTFKFDKVAIVLDKNIEAENKTEAYNIFKDFIKSTLPSRLDEFNKTSVKITEEEQ